FGALRSRPPAESFDKEELRKSFPGVVTVEGHPCGYVLTIAAGRHLARGWLAPRQARRFGPILLFAAALGVVFYRLAREVSPAAGFFSIAAILMIPGVFVHAQLAFCDSIVLSFWLLAWGAFRPALEKRRCAALFGLAIGACAAAKATGLIAAATLLPLYAVILTRRRGFRRGAASAALALVCAGLVFFALNPPLWHHPIAGMSRFVYLNTHRESYNIAIEFLGKRADLNHPLPWWNTLFWLAVTVPPGLLFGMILAPAAVRRRRGAGTVYLAIFCALTLLAVRAIPGLPVHDGTRLFIAAFPFAGIAAGCALARLFEQGGARRAASLAILAGSLYGPILYFPNGLSYYNALIGGAGGAEARGMEPTYYWDSLSGEVLEWLNRHTPPREAVLFAPFSTATLDLYRRDGKLTANCMTLQRLRDAVAKKKAGEEVSIPRFRWYVLQSRPGAYSPIDKKLLANKSPVLTVRVGAGALGEPGAVVLRVYRFSDLGIRLPGESANESAEPAAPAAR
ncbi:MAG: glycosyltransferase family 39 protein, partial [Thermoguttaceae bacterium]|nr:glycosyltransferase family 39 protein [Thermoguttaceae bacterium]